jgi:hypothetical protein
MEPPGPTTLAWPRNRIPPIAPVWLAETSTTWFSAARAQSYRSNSQACRSWASRGARLVRLVGQADRQARMSAPSRARVRAASGNVLS